MTKAAIFTYIMKKTNKLATAILLVLLLSTPLFSSDINGQKIHPISSDIYDAMNALYLSEGKALPSTSYPWSGAEIEKMLEVFDYEELAGESASIYDYIKNEVEDEVRFRWSDNVGVTTGVNLNFKMLTHTNPKDFDSFDDWGGLEDWNEVEPFLRLPLDVWMGSGSYGYFELFQANYRNLRFDDGYGWKDMYVGTNIPGLSQHASLFDTSLDFPNRGFLSLGGSWWNLFIGRDRFNWGPGETGNFQIGSQIPFLDSIKFTTFSEKLKFIMNITSFYHPMNLTTQEDLDNDGFAEDYVKMGRGQSDLKKGIRLFIVHRLEWRALSWLNFNVTESYMYSSKDTVPDGILLNPSTFFHNFYIRSNSNSLLSFELDATALPGWNIYFQMAIDEINGESEKKNRECPMAMAWMLGSKFSIPYRGGVFYGHAEGVVTDPMLYLRDSGQGPEGKEYGINFVVPIINNASGDCTWEYLGYRHGGDAIVCSLEFGYQKFGKWKAETELTYMAHGTVDQFTRWRSYWRKDTPKPLTKEHPDSGSYLKGSNWEERNAVSHTIILGLNGSWDIQDNLELYGILDYINVINSGNISGVHTDDLQLQLGVRYTL